MPAEVKLTASSKALAHPIFVVVQKYGQNHGTSVQLQSLGEDIWLCTCNFEQPVIHVEVCG